MTTFGTSAIPGGTARAEKITEQTTAFFGPNAADDFRTVKAAFGVEDARTMLHASAFGIIGAKQKAFDPEM